MFKSVPAESLESYNLRNTGYVRNDVGNAMRNAGNNVAQTIDNYRKGVDANMIKCYNYNEEHDFLAECESDEDKEEQNATCIMMAKFRKLTSIVMVILVFPMILVAYLRKSCSSALSGIHALSFFASNIFSLQLKAIQELRVRNKFLQFEVFSFKFLEWVIE
nr:hypothetical protein [Tanacetum cinerariifolium]